MLRQSASADRTTSRSGNNGIVTVTTTLRLSPLSRDGFVHADHSSVLVTDHHTTGGSIHHIAGQAEHKVTPPP